MSTESLLVSETAKWRKRAETEFAKIMASDDHPANAGSFSTQSKEKVENHALRQAFQPSAENARLSEHSSKIRPRDKKGEEFTKNIAAYLNDCKYFSEKKDYVRAFEAVVWAWAWIEIGKEVKLLKIGN